MLPDDDITDCQGQWRAIPNHETDDELLQCDGCGELWVLGPIVPGKGNVPNIHLPAPPNWRPRAT